MTKQRIVTIEVDGTTTRCQARTYHRMPKRYQERGGTLNGRPYLFLCTAGAGRGTMTRFYAYVQVGADVWYIDTGTDYLPDGAAVTF